MADTIRACCIATPAAVRELLIGLRARLGTETLSEDACGKVEIVLAEALNNIVEHAYPQESPGDIALTLSLDSTPLRCELRDRGGPLPGLAPPETALPDLTGPRETLPEGGFGWTLIRALTTRLSYDRREGENVLTLEFNAEDT